MGDGIDFDPKVAKAIREELTRSYETLKRQAASFEGLAQSLESCWRDESSNEVVELIRKGKSMYGTICTQVMLVENDLNEIERIYLRRAAAHAAEAAANQQQAQARAQVLRERYPDLGSHATIGSDRY